MLKKLRPSGIQRRQVRRPRPVDRQLFQRHVDGELAGLKARARRSASIARAYGRTAARSARPPRRERVGIGGRSRSADQRRGEKNGRSLRRRRPHRVTRRRGRRRLTPPMGPLPQEPIRDHFDGQRAARGARIGRDREHASESPRVQQRQLPSGDRAPATSGTVSTRRPAGSLDRLR